MAVKDLVSIADLSPQDLVQILATATQLKRDQKAGMGKALLPNKTLALLFQKPSLRTRVSFEVAMCQLGGRAIALAPNEVQLGERETVEDVGRVLSRYVDAIAARTNSHEDIVRLARFASVPVINALSDVSHPCQALADLLTIEEIKGRLAGIQLTYVGDGNNVAHSLILAGAMSGMKVVVATPPGFEPLTDCVNLAVSLARVSGGSVAVTNDPAAAVDAADVLYTDVWTSMGQEEQKENRLRVFRRFQLNASLVSLAREDAIVMHCLPAHRGEEITEEVIESPRSVVFQQAENRLHAQKAALVFLLAGRGT